MSSKRSAPPLTLELQPSRSLLMVLGAGHWLALISLIFIELPLLWTVPLAVGVLLSLAYYGMRYGHPANRWFVNRLIWGADDAWTVRMGDGREWQGRLTGFFRHPHLVILNFRGRRWWEMWSVPVLADAVGTEALRRLRVRLRTWRGMEET